MTQRKLAGCTPPWQLAVSTLVGLLSALTVGCTSPPNQRQFLVEDERILAISIEPAEVQPGQTVTLQAYLAGPTGEALDQQTTWSVCLAPKAPSEDNAVAAGCLGGADTTLVGAGTPQHKVTATVPSDACARFGPDSPPGDFRPRAADGSGGYYQPFRVDVLPMNRTAIGLVRILCNLPSAPPNVAQAYRTQYQANATPHFLLQVPTSVAANASVALTALWPATEQQTYLWFDTATIALAPRREFMRVSWFVTAGDLPVDATVVQEGSTATSSSVTWQAPPSPGAATIWAVLRDSRGGMSVQQATVLVE